jgi:E3 ubiquitin-protein ligase RNF115/126
MQLGMNRANAGDFVMGVGMDQLLAQLFAADSGRHGPPPASEAAVRTLPEVKLSQEQLKELKSE